MPRKSIAFAAVIVPAEVRDRPVCFELEIFETFKMSYMLQHLRNGWQVDQAILSEEDRVVIIRFGHDWDPTCMVNNI